MRGLNRYSLTFVVAGFIAGGCSETPNEVEEGSGGSGGSASDDDSIPPNCGNGMVDAEEDCDDGNDDQLDGCLLNCRAGPVGFVLGMPFLTPQRGALDVGEIFDDTCPAGQALIGVAAHVLEFDQNGDEMPDPAWLSGMQGICGELTLAYDGSEFSAQVAMGDTLNYHGSSMVNTEQLCPEHHVVVGFSGRNGEWIDQLTLDCSPITIVDDGTSFSVELGPPVATEPIGGPNGTEFDPVECGDGAAGYITNMRTATDVAAFGLGCGALTLQVGASG